MNQQTKAELRVIKAEQKVEKLIDMIADIMRKHPYTMVMFEEELRLRGQWPEKKEDYGNNETTSADTQVYPDHGVQ
jgi:hypothetical protein